MPSAPARPVLRDQRRQDLAHHSRHSPSVGFRASQADIRPGLPFFVFCLYTFALIGRPQDYIPLLVPLRLALVLTIVTCVVTAFQGGARKHFILRHRETKLYFILFAAMCAGIPFSLYPGQSFNSVAEYVTNIAFYVLFLTHVDTLERFRRIVFVLVLATLSFSVMGMVQGDSLGGRYSTGGNMFDPNDVAFVEISLLSFGLCVLFGSFRVVTKALALVSIILSILLTLYTGSRGGLLGLAAILVLFLTVQIPVVTKLHKALILIILVVAAMMVADADKIDSERYSTLTDLSSDYNTYDEFGRMQLWKRGFRLFLEDPLTGVGVDCFAEGIGTMRARDNVHPRWQTSHNSYLQVLTETGIVGGLAFLLLSMTCLRTFRTLSRRAQAFADQDLHILSGVLLIGCTGQLVAAVFLTQAYSALFTLLFAASASLKAIASIGEADRLHA